MWSKVGMGGEYHRYYKHTKFRQNPRGDPKFLVDLTRNGPLANWTLPRLIGLCSAHAVMIDVT